MSRRQPAVRPDERPDLVLVVLDDVGFSDLGCFGAEIHTPNLDALAAEGLRFNRFDTRAICSPSRAALLTGRNSHSVGMADLPAFTRDEVATDGYSFRGQLPGGIATLPSALAAAGYRTTAFGKWHLAPYFTFEEGTAPDRSSWPRALGFDHFYGFLGGFTDQYHPHLFENDTPLPVPSDPDYHLTGDLVDHVIAELYSDPEPGRPRFVYLATGAAHSPHQVPRRYSERYRGRYDVGWDVIRRERFDRQKQLGVIPQATQLPPNNPGDPHWDELTDQQRRLYVRFQEVYAGFVEHTDEQLGRLFEAIRNTGRDTIVTVLSDNGPAPEAGLRGFFWTMYGETASLESMEEHLDDLGSDGTSPQYPRPWAMVGATPFRRYKLWPFSGGMRTPLIVSWPGHIGDAGAVRSQFVEIADIAPTLLEAAGAELAEDSVEGRIPVAGHSFAACLDRIDATARTTQYFELRSNRAITHGDWKAVSVHLPGTSFDQDEWMLFNVADDFSESHDLAAEHPERLAELVSLWYEEAARYLTPTLRELPDRIARLGTYEAAYPPGAP